MNTHMYNISPIHAACETLTLKTSNVAAVPLLPYLFCAMFAIVHDIHLPQLGFHLGCNRYEWEALPIIALKHQRKPRGFCPISAQSE